MRIAFACHLVAITVVGLFGLVYLLRGQFMPYHAEAVAREWEAVEPAFQVLILALMRALGGAWLALMLAGLILLFLPFRQGARWARRAIPAIGIVAVAAGLYATILILQNTPASPPWAAAAGCLLLLILGLILSESGGGDGVED
jgi:peptidoglycan/LPS O-acetylase OafA/YrhL